MVVRACFAGVWGTYLLTWPKDAQRISRSLIDRLGRWGTYWVVLLFAMRASFPRGCCDFAMTLFFVQVEKSSIIDLFFFANHTVDAGD
jgi:hypothetical protein